MTKYELEEPWEVLDTGVIIHNDINKPLTLFVIEDNETPIKVRFVFKRESVTESVEIKLGNFDKDTIEVQIIYKGTVSNFGWLQPFHIGSFNGRDIHFNFRLDLNSNEDAALLHFTWYLGRKIVK